MKFILTHASDSDREPEEITINNLKELMKFQLEKGRPLIIDHGDSERHIGNYIDGNPRIQVYDSYIE